MIKQFKKPYRWAVIFSALLIGVSSFVVVDTFIITKTYSVLEKETSTLTSNQVQAQSSAVTTSTTYQDENIQIKITTLRENDTNIYVADIVVSDVSYLKTALANNTFGKNIKDTTSDIAKANNAIFAINGDYYGFRDTGFCLRNGELYRSTSNNNEALVIDNNGDFSIVNESSTSVKTIADSAWQIFSFGPALINNGTLVVDSKSEVSQSMNSNPRTAIGQISELHYLIVVSDGRISESKGLSLLQLANVFQKYGCTTAYNLDGGGSSTMYFMGQIVNVPTDGRTVKEREVSDIVYIGY